MKIRVSGELSFVFVPSLTFNSNAVMFLSNSSTSVTLPAYSTYLTNENSALGIQVTVSEPVLPSIDMPSYVLVYQSMPTGPEVITTPGIQVNASEPALPSIDMPSYVLVYQSPLNNSEARSGAIDTSSEPVSSPVDILHSIPIAPVTSMVSTAFILNFALIAIKRMNHGKIE